MYFLEYSDLSPYVRVQLSSSIHKRILVSLHSEVMPHLMEPRLLLDFLTDSYDMGGIVSLLALNGLFILMHQYHLWVPPLFSLPPSLVHCQTIFHFRDYPDFYTKLYGLLEPSIFRVKYMPRFFSLMDTFLSSTWVFRHDQEIDL